VLLILDNCEHVLDASARLGASLLRTCPDLHVLATSREPLSIDGEQVLRVPPLASPEPPDTPERVAGSAAAQLFLERARAVEPGFALTLQTAPAVAQVSAPGRHPARVGAGDGTVALLSVEQIAARLDDGSDCWLAATDHTRSPPTSSGDHGWSHGQLNDAERAVPTAGSLQRRVDSGAAEAACAEETLVAGDIVDLWRTWSISPWW
jgi:non-specific serine/threonine protein kinase